VQASEIIGLDIGQKRTGIARASSIARLAEPLMTIETEHLIYKLKEVFEKYQPECLVVGLPRNLQNQETQQTKSVRAIAGDIQFHFPHTPIKFQDEALTTVAAAERFATDSKNIDAVAASIILQDYLDEKKDNKDQNE